MEKSSQTKFSLADQVRIFKGIIGFGKPYWLPFALSFVATAIVAAISAYLRLSSNGIWMKCWGPIQQPYK